MARKYWPMGEASEMVIEWVRQKKPDREVDTTPLTGYVKPGLCVRRRGLNCVRTNKHIGLPLPCL